MFPTKTMLETHAHAGARHLILDIDGEPAWLTWVWGSRYLYVDPRDRSLAPHIALRGCWEAWNTVALSRSITPRMRCINIGANYGYFAILMAHMGGEVFAVEPNPRLARLMVESAEMNGMQLAVVRCVIGDRQRGAYLRIPPVQWGGASVHMEAPPWADFDRLEDHQPAVDPTSGEACHRVSMLTVDDVLDMLAATKSRVAGVKVGPHDARTPAFDLVFMDIEGAEPAALRGMQRTLLANPALQIWLEYSPDRLGTEQAVAFTNELLRIGPVGYVNESDGWIHLLPADAQQIVERMREAGDISTLVVNPSEDALASAGAPEPVEQQEVDDERPRYGLERDEEPDEPEQEGDEA